MHGFCYLNPRDNIGKRRKKKVRQAIEITFVKSWVQVQLLVMQDNILKSVTSLLFASVREAEQLQYSTQPDTQLQFDDSDARLFFM